jgi:putative tricarboxylic transport membrane protein
MGRWNSEVIGSLFWIAVGLFFFVGAMNLKLGTLRNPGPGFIPLGMASLLLCFSLFTLAKGLIMSTGRISRIPWKRPALVMASALLYVLLISRAGFLLSTFILMAILFGFLIRVKRRKWLSVFICSAAAAVTAWLIFSVGLRVPFP